MNCPIESWTQFVRQEKVARLPHAQVARFAAWALRGETRLHGIRRVMYGFKGEILVSLVVGMVLSVAMLGWWVPDVWRLLESFIPK